MTDFKNYAVSNRNTINDLRMPDKKKFYVNRKFDRYAYFDAVRELQEKIYDLPRPTQAIQKRLYYFTCRIAHQLPESENGKNIVISPVSIFIALTALALMSEGSSQKQIMDLLGYDSEDQLKEELQSLLEHLSVSTDFYTNLASSSIWLSDQVKFNKEILQSLADRLGTESFVGNINDPEYTSAIQNWINKATGNKLREAAKLVNFKNVSAMTVISTILFKALWDDEFNLSKTKPGTFHGPHGLIEVSYMYQEEPETIFFGETFTALSKSLSYGNSVLFILPDEGYAPEELVARGEIFNLFSLRNKRYIVKEQIPKFDITGSYDILKSLTKFGVKDIFDAAIADFHRTVKTNDNVYISEIKHKCRLKIDEKGCEGAAQTVAHAVAAGIGPDEKYDFVLDRPFIVIVRSIGYCPLFLGVVKNPN